MKPGKGMVATCSQGHLGLITEDEPKEVIFDDGTKVKTWVGIHLSWSKGKPGDPWCSRIPKVIGHMSPILMEYKAKR